MKAASIRARLDTCPHCHAAIIVGLDGHLAALAVRADPLPLDPHGELAARLAGRMTYDLVRTSGRQELSPRDYDLTHRPHPVVAAHTCPGPVPATAIPAPAPERRDDDAPTLFDTPDDIPF